MHTGLVLAAALLLAACRVEGPGSREGDGPRAAAGSAEIERKEAQLAQARLELERDPSSEEKLIWVGRRLAYLERFDEAQAVYGRGLEQHPDSFRILRHRGHRWITLRAFDKAVDDLTRAWTLC